MAAAPLEAEQIRLKTGDLLQGKVLADQVAAEGNQTVAVLYRQESYGQGLAETFKENFEAAGGSIELIPYGREHKPGAGSRRSRKAGDGG